MKLLIFIESALCIAQIAINKIVILKSKCVTPNYNNKIAFSNLFISLHERYAQIFGIRKARKNYDKQSNPYIRFSHNHRNFKFRRG